MSFTRESFLEFLPNVSKGKNVYLGNVELEIGESFTEVVNGKTYQYNLSEFKIVVDAIKKSTRVQSETELGGKNASVWRKRSTILFQEPFTRFACRVSFFFQDDIDGAGSEGGDVSGDPPPEGSVEGDSGIKRDSIRKINLQSLVDAMTPTGKEGGKGTYDISKKIYNRVTVPSLYTIEKIISDAEFQNMFQSLVQVAGAGSGRPSSIVASDKLFEEKFRVFLNNILHYLKLENELARNRGEDSPSSIKEFAITVQEFEQLVDNIYKTVFSYFSKFLKEIGERDLAPTEQYKLNIVFYNILRLYQVALDGLYERMNNIFRRSPVAPYRAKRREEVVSNSSLLEWEETISRFSNAELREKMKTFFYRYISSLNFARGEEKTSSVKKREEGEESLSPPIRVPSGTRPLFLNYLKRHEILDELKDVAGDEANVFNSRNLIDNYITLCSIQSLTFWQRLPKNIVVTQTSTGREHIKKSLSLPVFERTNFSNRDNWTALVLQTIVEDPFMPMNFTHTNKKNILSELPELNKDVFFGVLSDVVRQSFRDFLFFSVLTGQTGGRPDAFESIKKDFLTFNAFVTITKDSQTSPVTVHPLLPIIGSLRQDKSGNPILKKSEKSVTFVDVFLLSKKPQEKSPDGFEASFVAQLKSAISAVMEKGRVGKVTVNFMDAFNNKSSISVTGPDSVLLTSERDINKDIGIDYRANAHADVIIDGGSRRFFISLKKGNFSYWSGVNLERLGGLENKKRSKLSSYEKGKTFGKLEHEEIFSESGYEFVSDLRRFAGYLSSVVHVTREIVGVDEIHNRDSILKMLRFLLQIQEEAEGSVLSDTFDNLSGAIVFKEEELRDRFAKVILDIYAKQQSTISAKPVETDLDQYKLNQQEIRFLSGVLSSFVNFVKRQSAHIRYNFKDFQSLLSSSTGVSLTALFWAMIYHQGFLFRMIFGEERRGATSAKGAENVNCIIIGNVDFIIDEKAGTVTILPKKKTEVPTSSKKQGEEAELETEEEQLIEEASDIILSNIFVSLVKDKQQEPAVKKYKDFFVKHFPVLVARSARGKSSFGIDDLYVYVAPVSVISAGSPKLYNEITTTLSGVLDKFLEKYSTGTGDETEDEQELLERLLNEDGIRGLFAGLSNLNKSRNAASELKQSLEDASEQIAQYTRIYTQILNKYAQEKPKKGSAKRGIFRLESEDDIRFLKSFISANKSYYSGALFSLMVEVRFSLSNLNRGVEYANELANALLGRANIVCSVVPENMPSPISQEPGVDSSAEELRENKLLGKFNVLEEQILLPRDKMTYWHSTQEFSNEFVRNFINSIQEEGGIENFVNSIIDLEKTIFNIKSVVWRDLHSALNYYSKKMTAYMKNSLPSGYKIQLAIDKNSLFFDEDKIKKYVFSSCLNSVSALVDSARK